MSMSATFVQVDAPDLARLEGDPSLAETLFMGDVAAILPPAFVNLAATMQERMRTMGPQSMAEQLSRLDPRMRRDMEERLGRLSSAFAAGGGGDAILKLMEQRRGNRGTVGVASRAVLSLDKAWHGVHYLLCGEAEPGPALLSQLVLGGTVLGADDEGFSGYGPPRGFASPQVAELSQALNQPEMESEAAARFDPRRMSELKIYPGWRASDREWVLDAFRRLRGFYADAANQGRAMVTCLV